MRRLLAFGLLLAVLGAAACGGDDESATEQWAGDACSAVASWQADVQQIFGEVQTEVTSGDSGALAAIGDGIEQGVEATEQLVETLDGLGPPDTEAGEQAQQQLAAAADQVRTSIAQVQRSVSELGDADVQESIGSLAGLVVPLQAALGQVGSTIDAFRSSASDELRQAFEDASSCQDLRDQTTTAS